MAGAASGTVEPKDMECPVCHEDFMQPKILDCAHIFCRNCLVLWLHSERKAQCPMCRNRFADDHDGSMETCESIADSLPTDLTMEALVRGAKMLKKDHVCCAHPDVSAHSICLNCNDMLCSSCATAHGRLSATRHHKVRELAALTPEDMAASRPTICSTHSEVCKLFCPSHGEVICYVCATSIHRACPEMAEIALKVREERAELDELSRQLKAGETALECVIRHLEHELQSLEKRTNLARKEIDDTCDGLVKSVSTLRCRLKELEMIKTAEAKRDITRKRDIALDRRGKMTSHRRLVDRVNQSVPVADLHEMKTTLQSLVIKLSPNAPLPFSDTFVVRTLEVNRQAVLKIEKELQNLGQVTDHVIKLRVHKEDISPQTHVQPYLPGVLRFHSNHGKNTVLSENSQTAVWVDKTGHAGEGIVLSIDPMDVNTLYEVVVKKRGSHSKGRGYMQVGVVGDDPTSLNLPTDAWTWRTAVVIGPNVIRNRSHEIQSEVGKALTNIQVGRRVGLLVDAARCLHLYMDGTDQGVAARDISNPCFAMFQLWHQSATEITWLPMKVMT